MFEVPPIRVSRKQSVLFEFFAKALEWVDAWWPDDGSPWRQGLTVASGVVGLTQTVLDAWALPEAALEHGGDGADEAAGESR